MRKIVFDFRRKIGLYSNSNLYSIESVEPHEKTRHLSTASFRAYDEEFGLVIVQWKLWQIGDNPPQQFVTIECVEDDDWVCVAEWSFGESIGMSQVNHHIFSVAIYGCPAGDWVMV